MIDDQQIAVVVRIVVVKLFDCDPVSAVIINDAGELWKQCSKIGCKKEVPARSLSFVQKARGKLAILQQFDQCWSQMTYESCII